MTENRLTAAWQENTARRRRYIFLPSGLSDAYACPSFLIGQVHLLLASISRDLLSILNARVVEEGHSCGDVYREIKSICVQRHVPNGHDHPHETKERQTGPDFLVPEDRDE
ncbi:MULTISPECIES: hypothetical protein [Streptomyces]|uniref:Uncharacterized protein n=1 Tax=Streptomyces bobili TaxID=67280 RepID=A0ABZ1R7I1_9ACTN|nr:MULTISPECIES: hypothetical protein [Streptomyces]